MTIKIEDLIHCIEVSTQTMDIHTPSQDYYRRQGDSQTETITFVNANRLLLELKKLQDAEEYGGQNQEAYD